MSYPRIEYCDIWPTPTIKSHGSSGDLQPGFEIWCNLISRYIIHLELYHQVHMDYLLAALNYPESHMISSADMTFICPIYYDRKLMDGCTDPNLC